jgi:rRNA maturation endonuclease Nob1
MTYIIAECIACKQQMDIHENEFRPDDYPCCNRCGSPVVAIKAVSKGTRRRELTAVKRRMKARAGE